MLKGDALFALEASIQRELTPGLDMSALTPGSNNYRWRQSVGLLIGDCHIFAEPVLRSLQTESVVTTQEKPGQEWFSLSMPPNKLNPSHFPVHGFKLGDAEYKEEKDVVKIDASVYYAMPATRKFVVTVETKYEEAVATGSARKKYELLFSDIQRAFFSLLKDNYSEIILVASHELKEDKPLVWTLVLAPGILTIRHGHAKISHFDKLMVCRNICLTLTSSSIVTHGLATYLRLRLNLDLNYAKEGLLSPIRVGRISPTWYVSLTILC